jgi:hypothetical protein
MPRDLFGRRIREAQCGRARLYSIRHCAIFAPRVVERHESFRLVTARASNRADGRTPLRGRRNHVGRRGAPRCRLHLNSGRGFRPVLGRKGGWDRNLNNHALIDAIRDEKLSRSLRRT